MHALRSIALVSIVALSLLPLEVAARQELADLVGERVRLTPEGGGRAIVGTVTQQVPQALFVHDGGRFTRPVPLEHVERIERSLGRDSQETRGLLIGAGTGAFVSALLLISLAQCGECGPGTPVRGVLYFVSLGGVIGLIGGHIASHEDWVDVPSTSGNVGLRLGWEPRAGQLGLGLSVAVD